MNRYKITIAYIGTRFHGWQVQDSQRTVQGCLEEVIGGMTGRKTRVHGAGRTDAGVHARGQVAHFDVPEEKSGIPWQKALNAQIPRDMSVLDCKQVSLDFHSRFSAKQKEYSYTLWTENRYVMPQRRLYVWRVGKLNREKMEQASAYFVGEHDFASFQNVGSEVKSTVRSITAIHFEQGQTPEELVIRFRADGFLKQMVRNLVGTLVSAGKGVLPVTEVNGLLECRDRSKAPQTAPAKGLCLERVEYGTDGQH